VFACTAKFLKRQENSKGRKIKKTAAIAEKFSDCSGISRDTSVHKDKLGNPHRIRFIGTNKRILQYHSLKIEYIYRPPPYKTKALVVFDSIFQIL
jgi:hypothetical protein